MINKNFINKQRRQKLLTTDHLSLITRLVPRELMSRLSLTFGLTRHILPDTTINILHIREFTGLCPLHIVRFLLRFDLGSTHKNLKCKNLGTPQDRIINVAQSATP
ncbi:hypothetical protein KJ866_04545 [Patescibacteria group bacterium]|nr:hypothetical protein [Patescibacteria group bacterium]MBU2219745.1 hypothetical protein [Patescibacteria group bacterium]